MSKCPPFGPFHIYRLSIFLCSAEELTPQVNCIFLLQFKCSYWIQIQLFSKSISDSIRALAPAESGSSWLKQIRSSSQIMGTVYKQRATFWLQISLLLVEMVALLIKRLDLYWSSEGRDRDTGLNQRKCARSFSLIFIQTFFGLNINNDDFYVKFDCDFRVKYKPVIKSGNYFLNLRSSILNADI